MQTAIKINDIESTDILYNGTDLTITSDKLMEQFASLAPEEVDMLGNEDNLYLSLSEMDIIMKNYQSPIKRKEAYLDLYVHQHPCPSWVTIARTLRDFDLHQQADFVQNTYVKGKCDTTCS